MRVMSFFRNNSSSSFSAFFSRQSLPPGSHSDEQGDGSGGGSASQLSTMTSFLSGPFQHPRSLFGASYNTHEQQEEEEEEEGPPKSTAESREEEDDGSRDKDNDLAVNFDHQYSQRNEVSEYSSEQGSALNLSL